MVSFMLVLSFSYLILLSPPCAQKPGMGARVPFNAHAQDAWGTLTPKNPICIMFSALTI